MFGKEREGVHAVRLFDIAIIDVIGTVLIAILISLVTKIHVAICTVVLFVVAIGAHRLFCVNTKINTMIFGIV